MKKKIGIVVIIIIIIVALMFLTYSNIYCNDKNHRGKFPTNPYCTRCHGIDGIVPHKCTNPNGTEKYCSSCGKIVLK